MTDLLRLENVVKTFAQRRGGKHAIRAVDDVSLTVKRGETVGLVGESGCGKSTLARIALRLIEPTSGRVYFDGADITGLHARQMLPVRRMMQAVFQDPLASLNARMSILEIMREPFETHRLRPAEGEAERIRELLSFVGLRGTDLQKRPAEFSGGQLQRIAIARALAVDPEIIVADEPTSSLDPSIQAQITNLMLRIQRERRISYLVISHDLDAVGHIADWIAVMYLGAIVEYGPAPQVMGQPIHPYTQALLSAAPTLKARRDPAWQRILLGGDLPNPADTPSGCRFQSRCALVRAACQRDAPALERVESTERWVACHYAPDETEARGIAVANARLGHKAGGETATQAPSQTSEA